jgi:hypothetical protein
LTKRQWILQEEQHRKKKKKKKKKKHDNKKKTSPFVPRNLLNHPQQIVRQWLVRREQLVVDDLVLVVVRAAVEEAKVLCPLGPALGDTIRDGNSTELASINAKYGYWEKKMLQKNM